MLYLRQYREHMTSIYHKENEIGRTERSIILKKIQLANLVVMDKYSEDAIIQAAILEGKGDRSDIEKMICQRRLLELEKEQMRHERFKKEVKWLNSVRMLNSEELDNLMKEDLPLFEINERDLEDLRLKIDFERDLKISRIKKTVAKNFLTEEEQVVLRNYHKVR